MIDIEVRERDVHVYSDKGGTGFIGNREKTVKLDVVTTVIERGGK